MEFIDNVVRTPNTYVILGGDLLDNGIKNSVSSVYKQRYMPSQAKRMMVEMLKPLAEEKRILAAVMGNHERRSAKEVDDDPMLDIMYQLPGNLEHLYRENMAFIKIQIGNTEQSGNQNPTYVIVCTHGNGGGMTGAFVNKSERFGFCLDGADLLVVGHNHRPWTTQPGKIKIDAHNNKVSIKPFKVVSATSWLGYGGYAAAAMMQPTTYCPQKIILKGNKKEITVTM